jgi:hypothetical protein
MPLPSEKRDASHAVDEVAEYVDRIASLSVDLEDVVPEVLVSCRRELIVATQLLDRCVARAERSLR